MLRAVCLVFYSFGLILLNVFYQQGEVDVKINAPSEVDAGGVFRVKLVMTKSQLEGFSRFAQDLPAGLTASSVVSANADFTFQENRLRLIWLKLPSSDTVQVTYEIKVNERLKGTFSLGGRFSYIEENQRKSVEVLPLQIRINPSPAIDPRLIVDIKNFKDKVIQDYSGTTNTHVACIRQKPDLTYSQGGIIVSLLVNKEKLEKFAKIEEIIPAGYSAIALDKKDAIFTFRDQTVKFLWMTLPSEPWFTVSYKLVPLSGEQSHTINLKGIFSYIDGKKTGSVDIVEQDVSFDALTQVHVDQMLASMKNFGTSDTSKQVDQTNLLAGTDKIKTNTTTTSTTHQNNTTATNTLDKNGKDAKQTVAVNPINDKSKTIITPVAKDSNGSNSLYAKIKRTTAKILNERSVMAYSLEPETGIYYRVQIAAGHQPVNMKKYFRKMNFREKIRTEQHEGWFKYSIGSWAQYRDARDYRVQIRNTSTVKDAFVAAYNTGKRITVQEALMVSNQTWSK
jgi:hypothetical protein